ncbi:MAG: tail fiber domain-containing protein [Chitinophagales bacterium]
MKFYNCNFLHLLLLILTLGFFALQTSVAQDMEVGGVLKIDVNNTINNPAALHVGAGKEVLFGTDTLGEGSKVRWVSSKSAFRAGELEEKGNGEAQYWDYANIGQYSTALGYNNLAFGKGSVALGYNSIAEEPYSFAVGYNSNASDYHAIAIGTEAKASGYGATAIGTANRSRGDYSATLGRGNIARSIHEIVVGAYCEEYEPGDSTFSFIGTDRAFVVGNGYDEDERSNALTVLKNGNSGFGVSTPTERLHALGNMVIGKGLEADDNDTEFLQIKSKVQDWFVGAQNFDPDPGDAFVHPRFYISTAENNQNMFFMDTNGNVGIGDVPELSNKLEVRSDIEIGGGAEDYDALSEFMQIYGRSDWWALGVQNEASADESDFFIARNYQENGVFHIEYFGNIGIGTSEPDFRLHVNGSAGKPGGGSWSVASDKRLKKDVKPFTDGLKVLQQINPVTFRYNGEAGIAMDDEFVGIIAQDMKRIAPYMVDNMEYVDTTNQKSTNYLSFDPNALWYVTINAVKEQQKTIEAQNEQMETLQTQNENLENRLNKLEALVLQLADNNKPENSSEEDDSSKQEKTKIIRLSDAHLLQNQPNPFHENTSIEYFIPESVKSAILQITTVNGQLLYSHKIETRGQGQTEVEASQLSAGIYFYSLILDGKVLDAKQMMLTK